MAQKIHEEDLVLRFHVKGDEAHKPLLDLAERIQDQKSQLKGLQDSLKGLAKLAGKNSEVYRQREKDIADLTRSIEDGRSELKKMQGQLKATDLTTGELKNRIRELSTQMDLMIPDSPEWEKLNKSLQEAKKRFRELSGQVEQTKSVFSRFFELLPSWQVVKSAFNNLAARTEKARQAWLDYDEAMTDAIKTTNLSRGEMEDLAEELKKMDTRTPTNDLLGLVRAAGKLGVSGKENLLGFARAADKINVALSEDLGGDAEAAITAIGKMADIFGLVDQYGYEDSMLKIGSAINELGMASTANEGYIVDFSKRLAGIAPNADISIDKVLGLAATLDKYGQAAETSATAIGQTITAMFRKTETFAKIAHMSVKDFKDLLATDVNEALLRVLEGMKGSEGSLGDITAAMDAMHLKGQRATTVLGALANNVEELRAQQELSKQAFDDGTSMIDEFATKNETAQAKVEKLKNDITDLSAELGQKLQPAYVATLSATKGLLSAIISITGWIIKYRWAMIALTATIFAYVKHVQIVKAATAAWTAVKSLAVMWSQKSGMALLKETAVMNAQIGTEKAASVATAALAAAKAVLTGNLVAARLATNALWAAMKKNYLGLALAGLTAIITAITAYVRKSSDAANQTDDWTSKTKERREETMKEQASIEIEISKLHQLRKAVLSTAEGDNERRKIINRINGLYGDYLPHLLSEKSTQEQIAAALDHVNLSMRKSLQLKARMSRQEAIENEYANVLIQARDEVIRGSKVSDGTLASAAIAYVYGRHRAGDFTKDHDFINKEDLTAYLKSSGFDLKGKQYSDFEKVYEFLVDSGMLRGGFVETASMAINMPSNQKLRDLMAEEAVLNQLFGSLDNYSPDNNGGNGGKFGNGDPDPDKNKKTWSLSGDEDFLKAKAALQQQYRDGEIKTEQEFQDQLLQLEIDTLRSRIASRKESGKDLAALQTQLGEKELQQKKQQAERQQKADEAAAQLRLEAAGNSTEAQIEAENARYKKQKAQYQDNADALASIETIHQAKLAKIRLDGQKKEFSDMQAAFELEKLETENAYSARLANVKKGSDEEKQLLKEKNAHLLQMEEEYLWNLKQLLERTISTGMIGDSILSDEDLADLKKRLAEVIAELNKVDGEIEDAGKPAEKKAGKGELFGVSQDQWNQFFSNLAKGKIGAEDLGNALTSIGGMAEEGFKLASQWMTMTAAKEKKELKTYENTNEQKKASLKDRYDAGLMTEQQYNDEVADLEADLEAKREAMEQEQAEREHRAAVIQSIINTSLSVARAFVDWPWPASVGVASIVGALGSAETAMIAAQPVGYEEGGFLNVTRAQDGKQFRAKYDPNRRGFINGPTVITGESGREYVVPAEALANPSILPYINTIESARRAGRLKTLNMAVIRPSGIYSGLSSGGSISDTQPQDPIGSFGKLEEIIHELVRIMRLLDRRLESPIKAEVDYLGHGGIKESIEKDKAYRQRGKIK